MLSGDESADRAVVPSDCVHESLATEVLLGHRRRNRWMPGDTTSEVIRRLSGVDVHVLRTEASVYRRTGLMVTR
jgi:K+-sensing histidine kinase KdpD